MEHFDGDSTNSRLATSALALILATLVSSWLGMQAIHESGHVLGAWLSGGTVQRVVLHPLTISRTDLSSNPAPLFVVWMGPIVGVLSPLLLWQVAWLTRWAGAFVLRFFAGFCLIANGVYIGIGSLARIGDAGEMLALGSPIWSLWLFGLFTTPLGFWLWNGQGKHFGSGPSALPISRQVSYCVLGCAIALVVLGLLIGGS